MSTFFQLFQSFKQLKQFKKCRHSTLEKEIQVKFVYNFIYSFSHYNPVIFYLWGIKNKKDYKMQLWWRFIFSIEYFKARLRKGGQFFCQTILFLWIILLRGFFLFIFMGVELKRASNLQSNIPEFNVVNIYVAFHIFFFYASQIGNSRQL
eukprot:TRINITY_DN33810_c0_g1_i1.p2 TRINITY_DN33810_c0_g1~~TRINITY_DN33810_c0_g1_i1.p2  ORF type:complete len:150 (-),score=5.68 TRINITY_DN33810_c0_g1_i1:22-471(-)